MSQHDLTESLQELVRRHGLRTVMRSLGDMQAEPGERAFSTTRKRTHNATRKSSAVDYVDKMTLPTEKAEVMIRAAQCFEDGAFLPSFADIREFCRIHSVQLGKSVSRRNSIPRVFSSLAAMDSAVLTKMLDEGAFSGPTRLGPVADAIRNRSIGQDRRHHSGVAQVVSESTTAGSPKNP